MKKHYKFHFLVLLLGVFMSTATWAQERNVTGVVTDAADGSALPGVTIIEQGTSTGTVTDINGNYSISVNENSTLIFSFVGYESITKDVGAQSTINVNLYPDIQQLSELVVIGYGTQKRQDVTGAITTVSPEQFNKGVVGSPDQLLVGKVPGLTINRSGGDPTAKPNIQLRGPSSLTASSAPFYVIDGVPGASIDLVAPDDIESIDVLKDASSTAIYGSRAANGVIMVTTKRGKDQAPVFSYSGYVAVEEVSNRIDVLNASEYKQFLTDNGQTVAEGEAGFDTDWQDELYRTGFSQNHNLSYSGGSELTKYNASVNYFKNEGIVKRNELERVIARVGVDQEAFDGRLRMGLSLVNSMINSDHVDYGIFNGAARYLPVSPIMSDNPLYDPYGGYFQVPGRTNYNNPVSMLNNRDEERKTNLTLGMAKVGLDILPGLVLNMTGSFQREHYDRNYYMSREDFGAQALGMGYAERESLMHTEKIFESILNYSKTINENHELNLLAGYSYQNTLRNDGLKARNNTFSSDDLGSNNLLTGNGEGGSAFHFQDYPRKEESVLVSFFGRANYSFKGKYILSATLRTDGSSKFGVNDRWAMFPAVSTAWRISDESFMQDQNLFYDLKLRAGYGVSGNQNIPPYRSITLYGPQGDQFLYNGEFINSYSVVQNPNPDLKWETTTMINAGVDFGILGGRINGSVDVYSKETNDLLYEYNVSTPPYQFNRLLANGASMTNKGIEVMLNAFIIESGEFEWSSSANFAANKNEIGSLSSNIGNLSVSQRLEGGPGLDGWTGQTVSIVAPGYAIGTFYAPKYVGYDATTNETVYETKNGELVTADNLSTPGDYRVIGQALPKFTYGWSNTFSYKGFDFGFFLRGVYGNKIYNATRADLSRLNQASVTNVSKDAVEDGIFEAPVNSSRWLEDGSFLRLDNATLGYNFNLENNKYIKNARVYLTGTNLFTITKYTGVDPEVSLDGLSPGLDNRNYYPKTQSLLVGVNLSF